MDYRYLTVMLLGGLVLLACAGPAARSALYPASGRDLARAGQRVVAYYPGWTSQGQDPYEVADIPAARLTHLNYAFANVSQEAGQIMLGYPHLDTDRTYPGDDDGHLSFHGHFHQLLKLKEQHPHLKTLISVGGWTWSGNFSAAAETDQKRERFARSCAAFAARYGFDGVDVDWEYPASDGMQPGHERDTENFTLLLAAMRRALDEQGELDGQSYLLTIAAPGGVAKANVMELDQIHKYLDFINVMCYDFAGSWSPATNFNAPLYPTSSSLQPQDDLSLHANAQDAMQAYLDGGVPADKLVLGVPFGGKSWKGVPPENDGLYQPHDGGARFRTRYKELVAADFHGLEPRWHEEAQVPWLYDAEQGIMACYEDPRSMRAKGAYVREHGLGGVMFWQITSDDAESTLLKALTEGLVGPSAGE
ncbi:glycoside hydrolase family 18 protein [Candidatus Latescibacterota bacterium]